MRIQVVLSVSLRGILYIYKPGKHTEVRMTNDYAGAYALRDKLLAEYEHEQTTEQAAQPEALAA